MGSVYPDPGRIVVVGDQALLHRFAHEAMATTFEVVIAGEEKDYARQAAQEVFREIDRIEGLLSRFDPCSDIAQVNGLHPGELVRVSADVYECLQSATRVHDETGGAFDVTVGPLVRCWRDEDGNPRTPTDAQLATANNRVGMERLVLKDSERASEESEDKPGPREFSVGVKAGSQSKTAAGVEVDLGGIGKGYALDKSALILEDWEIESALLHGGTSTALAIGSGEEPAGCCPGERGWPVGVGGIWGKTIGVEKVHLWGEALSGSGTEVKGEHVLDPRTGLAADAHLAAWVRCASAARADALSTAFMVMSTEEVKTYCDRHPDVSSLVIIPGEDSFDWAIINLPDPKVNPG